MHVATFVVVCRCKSARSFLCGVNCHNQCCSIITGTRHTTNHRHMINRYVHGKRVDELYCGWCPESQLSVVSLAHFLQYKGILVDTFTLITMYLGDAGSCIRGCSYSHYLQYKSVLSDNWQLTLTVCPRGCFGVHRRPVSTHIVHIKWLFCVYIVHSSGCPVHLNWSKHCLRYYSCVKSML